MKLLRSLIAGIALAVLASGAALAQCGTTAPANKFCGNDTGSQALATWKTIPPGALSPIIGGTVLGNRGAAEAVPTPLTNPVLGVPGASTGEVGLAGATSGTAILRAQAAAGSAVVLLPTSAGTLVSTASSPLAINSTTGQISVTGIAGGVLAGSGPAFTRTPVLGVAGSAVGSIGFQNATSGTVTLQPVTGALGIVTINIPAAAGTMAVSGTAPLAVSAAGAISCTTCATTTSGGALSGTAPITVSAGGAIGITGSALTKADDTNVTLTLGGTPASSLVAPTSLTLGWTGQLSIARGGTGQATAAAAITALMPTATGAGGVPYWNGTNWTVLAGNASGTNCLQENSVGVPAWAACSGGGGGLTVGTTSIASGTTTRVLYDNAGTLGEYAISGTGSVAMTTSPSFTTPTLGAAVGTSLALGGATLGVNALAVTGSSAFSGAMAIASTSANSLAVGANGTTNPGFQVDNSVASAATGIKIFPQAAGSSVSLRVISSGTNEALGIDAKGSGQVVIGSLSTGGVRLDGALVFNGAFSGTGFGTNVATALGTATGSANGFPLVIASGTIALGTSAVSAGACSAAATASATGTATTDVIDVSFNGDPTATTGYTAAGMLSLIVYPTANTVNVKQCNLTGSSITPSALTLNWKVRR